MLTDASGRLGAEPHEGLLNDISSPLHVAGQPLGVPDQWAFKSLNHLA